MRLARAAVDVGAPVARRSRAMKKTKSPTPTAKSKVAKKQAVAPAFEVLSFDAADVKFDGALGRAFQGSYETVLFLEGNVAIDGDFFKAISKLTEKEFEIIAVKGDLTVSGRIALYESLPGLYVSGATSGDTLEGGDCEIYVQDGTFKYFVYGYYNDGTLDAGKVVTPWVINSNHDLRVTSEGARTIDNYGDDDDYEFGSENIGESFAKGVLSKDGSEIKIDSFLAHLMKGKPVLKAGAKSGTEKALADIAVAASDQKTEIDFSEKKLKAFPPDVLKMTWLTKLVLDGNAITEIPAAIGNLKKLEVLSLNNCDLAALPEEIGELTSLRVLNVASNTKWEFHGDASTMIPIALPASVGKLVNLEELDVSGLSEVPRDPANRTALPPATPYVLPEGVSRLPKLRRIVANQTALVFPEKMRGLASVEEIVMRGSSSVYLREFPAAVTTFPNLKKLDVSANFFREIPQTITKLANLEELNINNALGFVKALPDLSALKKLRVLRLSGNTSHTGVRVPAHDVLRPLFAMDLSALEELGIDRWGEEKKTARPRLPAELLTGIGKFRSLKKIDLEFDALTSLPEDFFALTKVEELKLKYNALDRATRERISQAFPRARIDFRDQKVVEDKAELEGTSAAQDLVKKGNALRAQQPDAAIAKYDEAIALLERGTAEDPYNLLYAHYGKMWIDATRGYAKKGTAAQRKIWKKAALAEAEACMRLVPPVWQIWHFTDEGQFHREVARYATNVIAWEIYEHGDDLQRARTLIEQGAACADDEHLYIFDTQARVLLKLGMLDDAWRVVHKVLHRDSSFAAIQDLAQDQRYRAWSKGNGAS
jgi:Leucine-rich repeat (LRR) protein